MKEIYPGDTRAAIKVFQLYEAQGEYFDISNPSNIVRDTIVIGRAEEVQKAMEEKLSQMTLADVKKDVAAWIEKEQ